MMQVETKRRMLIAAAAAALSAWALRAAPAKAETALDVIPEDAAGAVVINDLASLCDKVDKFAAENGLAPQGVQPSSFLRMGLEQQFKGSKDKGLDEKRPLLVVAPSFGKAGVSQVNENTLVVFLPITSAEAAAPAFGELKEGAVTKKDGKFYLLKGKYVLVGEQEKAVTAAADAGKALSATMPASQKATLEKADIFVHVSPDGTGEVFLDALKLAEQALDALPDPTAKAQLSKFLGTAKGVRYLDAAVRIADGVGLSLLAPPRKNGEFADLLANADPYVSNLEGLPAVQPLVAGGGGSHYSKDHKADVAVNVKQLRERMEKNPQVKEALGDEGINKIVTAVEKLSLGGKGSKFVAYRTADQAKSGAYAGIMIVEHESPEEALAQVGSLVDVANNAIANAAKNAPAGAPIPKLEYSAKAETVAGARVDTVSILIPADKKAEADEKIKPFLGGDWAKIRIGVQGKNAVVMLGSDADSFAATLDNLAKGEKGLAAHKAVLAAQSKTNAKRGLEFHFSVKNIIAIAMGAQKGDLFPALGPVEALTSVVGSVDAERAELEFFVPAAEIKAIIGAAMAARGGFGA